VRRVFEALLGTGAALPLLTELLTFAGKTGLDEKLEDALPGVSRFLNTAAGADGQDGSAGAA
jgi:hypothetical protein